MGPAMAHIQSHLLVGDVRAGHGDLFWGVEVSSIRHSPHTTAGGPYEGRRAGADLRQGYAQPAVRPGATILIDAQNHFDCRATGGTIWR